MTQRQSLVSIAVALALFANRANAQLTPVIDSVIGCDYRVCALTISPTWNGLAVKRGTSGATVANLNFFFPHDISVALGADNRGAAGSDSVVAIAQRAVRLRRVGAAFTDLGILALGVAAGRALTSASNESVTGVLAGIGATALGVSVPFQFAADGALSRAVWWYNLRYARSSEARSR